jgi:uncharacterized iron-regulated membrane protein
MRRKLVTAHRWLSLACALFWIVQALTGALIVFHWEVRDATFKGPDHPTDIVAIGSRIALIEDERKTRVESLWTTAGFPDRYTLFLADGGSVDIAGDGRVLAPTAPRIAWFFDTLVGLHHELLAGETGQWVVGISSALLASNIVLALWLAWPKSGFWRTALRPKSPANGAARYYGWHRAIGLWAALPALLIVATGTLLRFEDGTARLIGYEEIAPGPVAPTAAPRVGFARAVESALAAIPGSRLVSVAMPSTDDALFRLRVLEPGEWRRAYGTSRVFVNSNDGRVIAAMPASAAGAAQTFMESLFAIHTGEAGGFMGRWMSVLLGLWLTVMVVLGILLWQSRRKRGGGTGQ